MKSVCNCRKACRFPLLGAHRIQAGAEAGSSSAQDVPAFLPAAPQPRHTDLCQGGHVYSAGQGSEV